MTQPTGKQQRALSKINRRIARASIAAQFARTPQDTVRAHEQGLRAITALANLQEKVRA